MKTKLLLCTDLDRTLIPNGEAPESPQARQQFHRLVSLPGVTLAYVSGRDQFRIKAAIDEFDLPSPDFVVADVGSTIYRCQDENWHCVRAWDEHIGVDWNGRAGQELAALLAEFSGLQQQESSKQNTYKLSYYVSLKLEHRALLKKIQARLSANGIQANLIWSIDEADNIGLLDILPLRANKRHAIEFLMQQFGFSNHDTVFAGDSGNDLAVLISPIPSILVNNASADLKSEVLRQATVSGLSETIYIAHGNWSGMNGNYAAGILEGVANYHPSILAPQWASEYETSAGTSQLDLKSRN